MLHKRLRKFVVPSAKAKFQRGLKESLKLRLHALIAETNARGFYDLETIEMALYEVGADVSSVRKQSPKPRVVPSDAPREG